MTIFKRVASTTFTLGLSLSLLACGSEGTATTDVLAEQGAPTTKVKTQLLFEEDIAKHIRQSTPNDINLPLGLDAAFDIEYRGAFRVEANGESTSDYAVGTLGYNPDNNSIFMAGHSHHNAIAEFEIPSKLSFDTNVKNIPEGAVIQEYVKILNKKEIGNRTDKINGILYHNQNLIVSSEIAYDGEGNNRDNLQVFTSAVDIRSSGYVGMLQLEGAAKAAGYMFKVPDELISTLGTEYMTGWASNYSIRSRYSQGPSLYRFNPDQAIDAVPTLDRTINTQALMVFPFVEGKELADRSGEFSTRVSPYWGPVAKAKYGFIIPGTSYFLAVGQHSGLHSGIGYKITQDSGKLCGGYCSYEASDLYNYFWIFDINEMLTADEPWKVSPISFGKWSHPHDNNGSRGILGGTFDEQNNMLYLTLEKAGRIGTYDRPPLIIGYQVKAKN